MSAEGILSTTEIHVSRPVNSAPPPRIISPTVDNTSEQPKPSVQPRRSLARITSAKNSLKEFRLHPERFLSPSNRYLPLLRRQMSDISSKDPNNKMAKEKLEYLKKQRLSISPPISRLSDGSDLTYDEAKSFLSEEIDLT